MKMGMARITPQQETHLHDDYQSEEYSFRNEARFLASTIIGAAAFYLVNSAIPQLFYSAPPDSIVSKLSGITASFAAAGIFEYAFSHNKKKALISGLSGILGGLVVLAITS